MKRSIDKRSVGGHIIGVVLSMGKLRCEVVFIGDYAKMMQLLTF